MLSVSAMKAFDAQLAIENAIAPFFNKNVFLKQDWEKRKILFSANIWTRMGINISPAKTPLRTARETTFIAWASTALVTLRPETLSPKTRDTISLRLRQDYIFGKQEYSLRCRQGLLNTRRRFGPRTNKTSDMSKHQPQRWHPESILIGAALSFTYFAVLQAWKRRRMEQQLAAFMKEATASNKQAQNEASQRLTKLLEKKGRAYSEDFPSKRT